MTEPPEPPAEVFRDIARKVEADADEPDFMKALRRIAEKPADTDEDPQD